MKMNRLIAILFLLTSIGWLSASQVQLRFTGKGLVSNNLLFPDTEPDEPQNKLATPPADPVRRTTRTRKPTAKTAALAAAAHKPLSVPPKKTPFPEYYCFSCDESCGRNAAVHAKHPTERVPGRFTSYICTECPNASLMTRGMMSRYHSGHKKEKIFNEQQYKQWIRDKKRTLAHAINAHSKPSQKQKMPRAYCLNCDKLCSSNGGSKMHAQHTVCYIPRTFTTYVCLRCNKSMSKDTFNRHHKPRRHACRIEFNQPEYEDWLEHQRKEFALETA